MSSSRCYILKLNTRLKTKKPPIDKFSSQLIRTQITKNLYRNFSKSLRNKNNVENDKFLNINVKQQRSTLPCIITQKTKNSWHKAENNKNKDFRTLIGWKFNFCARFNFCVQNAQTRMRAGSNVFHWIFVRWFWDCCCVCFDFVLAD
jgi:hypothetical protein